MSFALDRERMLVTFTVDDRDLAVAFAELEGFVCVSWCRRFFGSPLPPDFTRKQHKTPGVKAYQLSPGLWAYRITRPRKPAAPSASLSMLG